MGDSSSSGAQSWCETPLWDSRLSWAASRPDLTECFHGTVPVLLPSVFLWLFTPYFLVLHFKTQVTRDFPKKNRLIFVIL